MGDAARRYGDGAERAGSYLLVLVLAVLASLWGAFLIPLRVLDVPVPVSVVIALGANAALCTVGGRLYGRWGAGVPGLIWFAVAVALQTRRPEGDLVVPGTWTGLAFLVLGSMGAAIAVGLTPSRRAPSP